MVDIIRLDHFIGYAKYFRIPICDNTAHEGDWISAPGDKLFKILYSTINNFNIIVEDLGDVTEDVITLRNKYDFPGMHVLQFESDKILEKEDFPINSLVCTGTHDNDTILGWFETLDKNQFIKFFNCNEENVHWEFINYALGTSSNMVVLPMQDILGKKSVSRFNIPGTLSSSNWSWRMGSQELTDAIIAKMKALTEKNRRNMYNIKSLA